jgi:hypothetical protein
MNNPTSINTTTATTPRTARNIGGLGFIIMLAALAYAFIAGNFSVEGDALMAMPWGVLSVVDAYIGLILFCCWVYWREAGSWPSWLWIIAILVLGNVLSCVYVLVAAYTSGGDSLSFWCGKRIAARTSTTNV